MTIHLSPHPFDGPTRDAGNYAASSSVLHIFVGSAIAIVGLAITLFVAVNLGRPPALGLIAGLTFTIAAAMLHLRLARGAAPIRTKPARRTARTAKPAAEMASSLVAPSLAAEPSSPPVEASDLALALLASLNAPPASSPAQHAHNTEAWTRAIAAHLDATVPGQDPPLAMALEPLATPAQAVSALAGETEVQRVERLVKRLADNVNQLQAMRQSQPADYSNARQLGLFPESDDPSHQLEASINALRRANAAPVIAAAPLVAEPVLQAWPQPVLPPARDRLADSQRTNILSALNAQRIDVYLEPILDLADQRPQHYEVSIALRTHGGHAIDLTHAANDLSGTGLLPLIDQARIAHAANVARRLADRGKTGAVFTDVNGETLEDGGFQDTFANETISVGAFPGQLVLTLPQAHVSTFTVADWHTLARLREAGFGFALSDVTNLDMDFPRLVQAGFNFARLDAETFLIGLPTSGDIVPPADICRHLAASGLILIVGGILEDHQLARIFGFGVLFGQGRLFGGPRPMKQERAAEPQSVYAGAAPAE